MKKQQVIYIIAGEASGDLLGGRLMQAIEDRTNHQTVFYGVGGRTMEDEGLESLFPMSDISIMGFWEILPKLPLLLWRLSQTIRDIEAKRPDLVITIDSPGFNCRIAKKLQKKSIPLIHYVAPTVWAYKPKRAKKFAKLFDHLMVLLPFEPPFFTKVGLETTFVGHPIIESTSQTGNRAAFLKHHHIDADAQLLLAMPGSRKTEVSRLMKVYLETFLLLKRHLPHLHVVIPTLPHLKPLIQSHLKHSSLHITLVDTGKEKDDALAACNVGLIKSGTSTLEVAQAGLPMVVCYKVSWLSYMIIRNLVKIPYATLLNLVAKRMIIPEYLQTHCTAKNLSAALVSLFLDKTKRHQQCDDVKIALKQLQSTDHLDPSHKAAKVVLSYLLKN